MEDLEVENRNMSIGEMKKTTAELPSIRIVERCEEDKSNTEDHPNESHKVKYQNICYGILVIFCCVLFSSPTILIPQHDTIKYPEYWYEGMINFHLTYPLHWLCVVYMSDELLLQTKAITSFRSGLLVYTITVIVWDITYCTGYLFWTFVLGLNWPIPFIAFTNYVGVVAFIVTLWYQFPLDMRADEDWRKKIKAYLQSGLWTVFVSFEYQLYTKIFQAFPNKLQWVLPLMLPIALSWNKLVHNKIVKRCAASNKIGVKMYNNIVMIGNHALFISIIVGSSATQATSFSFFLVKFLTDIHHCYKILRIDKKIRPQESNVDALAKQKLDAVSVLALVEIMEVLIPLTYGITFSIAYYGPNSTILGNIGSSKWHFNSVKNIGGTLTSVSQMFLIDLFTGVVIGVILWKSVSINLLAHCCNVMKTYWPWMAIRIAVLNSKVA